MEYIIYLVKIAYHFILALLMYVLPKMKHSKLNTSNNGPFYLSAPKIVFLSLMEGLYSIICGPHNVFLYDREIYAYHFQKGYYSADTLGLALIKRILSVYTKNPYVLFFVFGFLFMLLTCIAFNLSLSNDVRVLLLVGLSLQNAIGCYALKQAIAAAFCAIAILLWFRKKNILAILSALLAICFHEVALILIPLLVLVCFLKGKVGFAVKVLIIIVFVVGFGFFNRLAISLLTAIVPSLKNEIGIYLTRSGGLSLTENLLTAVKGIPLYYISGVGFVYRKKLKPIINDYDAMLLVSIMASAFTLLSLYMYWLWRISELLYFVVFDFFVLWMKKAESRYRQLNYAIVALLLLIITIRHLFICYFNYGGII